MSSMAKWRADVRHELTSGFRSDLAQTAKGWRWGRRPMVPRSAEQHTPGREQTLFPSAWSRTLPAAIAREALQKGALEPALRHSVDVQVHGRDVLTQLNQPVVLVANHSSHLDTPLILCTLPDQMRRRTAVAAAADYFFDTWWRAASSSWSSTSFRSSAVPEHCRPSRPTCSRTAGTC